VPKQQPRKRKKKMENVMENVQTKPEVPLGSPAKEVQPEAHLEPTAKENIPAATVADNSANDGADIKITAVSSAEIVQTQPGVTPGSPAKEVQPEVQPEPTAK
jgi:hypothetical protein